MSTERLYPQKCDCPFCSLLGDGDILCVVRYYGDLNRAAGNQSEIDRIKQDRRDMVAERIALNTSILVSRRMR